MTLYLLSSGQENGPIWVPTETEVTNSLEWYYHTKEESHAKSLSKLVDI